jgi:hypothetical protein
MVSMIGLAGLLSGCGGGGAGGSSDLPNISLSIERLSDGQKNSPVTSSEPAKIVISVNTNELITLTTSVGTLSKESVSPINGKAEVTLSVTLDDVNDGQITATQVNGASKTLSFSVGATELLIGTLDGNTFTNGQLKIGQSVLSAGGTTEVTAVIWKSDSNQVYTSPINVLFTSNCISTGKSTISSPILASNGIASTTYKAINCQGNDQITATISVGGSVRSANGTLTFPASSSNSIEFVSANPNLIYLTGVGASQTEVKFRVLDSVGSPISNVMVDFELNTSAGGLALTATSNQTDADGIVSTFVTPGSVPTALRVTATVRGTQISSQSSQLAVTTGLPAQDRISVSVGTHAVEAFEYDNVTVPVTAFLADRYGNPSPDRTTVTFRSEVNGGALFPSFCETKDGTCTVTWRSQGTRPEPHRVTILASALGEESFVDANGNGRYDSGEAIFDLPEAYVDANESLARDSNEEFVDFNSNIQFDPADGLFSGALCNSGCAGNSVHVRANNIIVMSSSTPANLAGNPAALDLRNEQVKSSSFTLKDVYGQPMPAGTTVTCSANVGALQQPSSFTVPDTTSTSGYPFSCSVKGTVSPGPGEVCTPTTGTMRVEVKTPRGLSTFFAPVAVTDNAKCELTTALSVTTAALPGGTVGVPYVGVLLAASGGTAPYTWAMTGAPVGLTVTPTGFISGTPTVAGTAVVSITARDVNGVTGNKVMTLTILP